MTATGLLFGWWKWIIHQIVGKQCLHLQTLNQVIQNTIFWIIANCRVLLGHPVCQKKGYWLISIIFIYLPTQPWCFGILRVYQLHFYIHSGKERLAIIFVYVHTFTYFKGQTNDENMASAGYKNDTCPLCDNERLVLMDGLNHIDFKINLKNLLYGSEN